MECSYSSNAIPEIVEVEEKLKNELLSYFKGEKDGYVQVGKKKWFFPIKYKKVARDYKDFKVRDDDVWITGLPRSGTTVTQELVWLLTHNLDYEGTKEHVDHRVRFFETYMTVNDKTVQEVTEQCPDGKDIEFQIDISKYNLKWLNEDKKRRVIKTHLPFELLPADIMKKGCKVIYLCRNPRDVSVSYFFLQSKSWHIQFGGDFAKYWEYFRNGNCMFGPYFEHVKQGFEKKGSKNFLFLFYEELRQNLKECIKKISEFLERPLTDEELKKLEDHLDFENFKKISNTATVGKDNTKYAFVRKGQVGGWKNHFTEEMKKDANEWIEKNTKEIGFKYPSE